MVSGFPKSTLVRPSRLPASPATASEQASRAARNAAAPLLRCSRGAAIATETTWTTIASAVPKSSKTAKQKQTETAKVAQPRAGAGSRTGRMSAKEASPARIQSSAGADNIDLIANGTATTDSTAPTATTNQYVVADSRRSRTAAWSIGREAGGGANGGIAPPRHTDTGLRALSTGRQNQPASSPLTQHFTFNAADTPVAACEVSPRRENGADDRCQRPVSPVSVSSAPCQRPKPRSAS